MIVTLRGNNGSFANLGSVTVQPVGSIVSQATQQTTTQTHQSSPGVVPARQASISTPVLLPASDSLRTLRTPTLSDVANLVTTTPHVVVPLHIHGNTQVPTHALQLNPGRTFDARAAVGFAKTARKFQPYEQLTGIAQDRPEILMLTNFQPLFNRDVSHTAPDYVGQVEDAGVYQFMTDAGRFIDTQIQMRNLRAANSNQLVSGLVQRYPGIAKSATTNEQAVAAGIRDLNVTGSFFLNLVRMVESTKSQLDLRHDLYLVEPTVVAQSMQSNFVQAQPSRLQAAARPALVAAVEANHPPKYDFNDTLVALGYTADNVQNVFASTKLWLQTLLELQLALKFHTLPFLDMDTSYQRNDSNASVILSSPTKRFSVATTLPAIPKLADLINLQPANVAQASVAIDQAFQVLYQDVTFKDEEARITALAHLLSQEYRYSYGLTQPSVQRALHDFYGYSVAATNTAIFDSIIGQFGNNITDFPTQASHALASIAQQTPPGTAGVLTFETKYVVGDTGTLTPGGDFYFDQIMQTDGSRFNVTNINSLSGLLDQSLQAFNVIIDGLNLMSRPLTLPSGVVDTPGSILTSTADLLDDVLKQLVDANGNTLPVARNDQVGSLYARARTDDQVRTTLFLYTMAKVSRAYGHNVSFFASATSADNTPLVDALIQRLVQRLAATITNGAPVNQLLVSPGLSPNDSSDSLTDASIASALRAGTPLTTLVEQLMSQVLSQFQLRTSAMTNGHTLYSGYLDTVVMMVTFDLITSMVARYSNQSIVGTRTGTVTFSQNLNVYVVSRTSTNQRASINELHQRATGEDTLVQQMVMTLVNMLQNLAGSLKNVSNYLQSPAATSQLQSFAAFIGDPALLRMVLSEQQIMLMASTSNSLLLAQNATSAESTGVRLAKSNPRASTQAVKVLDGSIIDAKQRDALYAFFQSQDLASVEAGIKKVLTVGIPLGFTQQLKQEVSIQNQARATFQDRRNDIVQVNVYKVDMQNGDVVFKPQSFLFELSRFPVRFATTSWLPLPQNAAEQDVINSIPTQSYLQDPANGTASSVSAGVEYASAVVAGNDGVKGARVAFDDSSYSFLTTQQKAELLSNHIASQLLESYIKLMTGINVAEYDIDLVDPPPPMDLGFVTALAQHAIAHVAEVATAQATTRQAPEAANPAGGVLFSTTATRSLTALVAGGSSRAVQQPQLSNPSGVAGNVSATAQARALFTASPATQTLEQQLPVATVDASLDAVTARHVPLALESLRTVNSLSNTVSSLSNVPAITKRVLSPKQFDRVFSLLLDPNDFLIDVAATIATPYGKAALTLMVQNGDVVEATENDLAVQQVVPTAAATGLVRRLYGRDFVSPNVNNYKWRLRTKAGGDLLSEQYFVTVSTFAPDEV